MPHSKKMAFFRENIHSADEGMIDDHETENVTCNSCNTYPATDSRKNQNSKQNSKEDSSDTEGEDIISEAVENENNQKDEIFANGHSNCEENKSTKSVSYKFVYNLH